MSFLANDKEFLRKYTKLWGKIKDLIGKKFDSEPIYNDNYIKTKIKSYIITNFRHESNNRKVPKEDCSYKCLSLISLDSSCNGQKIFSSNTFRRV